MKQKKAGTKYTQRGCVTSLYSNAVAMLSNFGGKGYIYNFGSYWAVYTV